MPSRCFVTESGEATIRRCYTPGVVRPTSILQAIPNPDRGGRPGRPLVHRLAFAAALLLLTPFVRAEEFPLAASEEGPRGDFSVIGAVRHGDGFFLVRREFRDDRIQLLGTHVSASGEVLDPRGILLVDMFLSKDGYPLFTVDIEQDRVVIVESTKLNNEECRYKVTRHTLDVDATRITGHSATFMSCAEHSAGPRNARGERLEFTSEWTGREYRMTLWFVGADDVRRNATPLRAQSVLHHEPYGDDEWLIVGAHSDRIVWYRLSEKNRATPLQADFHSTRSAGASGFFRTIQSDHGELAVLSEALWRSPSSDSRALLFRVIRPDGASWEWELLAKSKHRGYQGAPGSRASLMKDGNGWLVAFAWSRVTTDFSQERVRLWRVEGRATETSLPSLQQGTEQTEAPLLVKGASRNLLLYQRLRTAPTGYSYDPYLYVWSRGSDPVDPPVLMVRGLPSQAGAAGVAADRGIFAAWREGDDRGDVMVRITRGSRTSDAPVRLSSPSRDAQLPVVARNGNTIAVAWIEVLPTKHWVLVRRFDSLGGAVDPEPIVVMETRAMPNTFRIAIGAEDGGFRLAWHGRAEQTFPGSTGPLQTVYTLHLDARDMQFEEPEAVTPVSIHASEPVIVSDSTQSLLLWTEARGSSQEIRAQRYVAGLANGNSFRIPSDARPFTAAARENEVLLLTLREDPQRGRCTDAQRFSFTGAALAPAITIDCFTGYKSPAWTASVVWEPQRWWAKTWSSGALASVRELDENGTPVGVAWSFAENDRPHSVALIPTKDGLAALIVKPDATQGLTPRAFVRLPHQTRSRRVRH